MEQRRLGRTGLQVTSVGFGGIPIIPLGMDEGAAVVRRCFDLGVNFFDTANMYADSEKKIGLALADVRDQVVLATKSLEREAAGVARHIDLSLDNLRTDRIDLYQLHSVSKAEELEAILSPGGALEAAQAAREEGKLGHIGFSSHDIATAVKACRTGHFSTVQIPFNFVEQEPADRLFSVAREMDMGIIGMKPFGGGLLDRIDLCLKFLKQHTEITPIPGLGSVQEAEEVIGWWNTLGDMTETDLADMDEIRSELGDKFCHRCGYCGPCEQGVNISGAMMFRPMVRRLGRKDAIVFGQQAVQTIVSCTGCGECEFKCPYSLPIPDLLQEILAQYKSYGGSIEQG